MQILLVLLQLIQRLDHKRVIPPQLLIVVLFLEGLVAGIVVLVALPELVESRAIVVQTLVQVVPVGAHGSYDVRVVHDVLCVRWVVLRARPRSFRWLVAYLCVKLRLS